MEGVEEGNISDENIDVFKCNMMNCIMNILKVFHPTNDYLYIPDDHNCEDNTDIWIQTRKEVESNRISVKDIWKIMIEK